MYKIKNEQNRKRVNPLLQESRVEEAFRPGKSKLVVKKLERILFRRLKTKIAICPLPTSIVNSKGKFLQYFGGFGKDVRIFSIDFHIGSSEEIYSISFYDNKLKPNQPTRVAYLNGFNIVQVIDQIADLFTGVFDTYEEAYGHEDNRVREADTRMKLVDMTTAYLQEFPDYAPEIIKDKFDYEGHIPEFLSFILRKFGSKRKGITAGALKYNLCQTIEQHPEFGSFASIPVISVTDNPPKNTPTNDSLSPENQTIWDAVESSSAQDKWAEYERWVKLIGVADPHSYSLIAYGMPGTGKTHECKRILGECGANFIVLGSAITDMKAIMIQLYEHREDEVVVFDDLDSILSSSNRSNMFKQVFQQKKVRTIGMNATVSYRDEDGNKQTMPPTFEFTSRCIMLSNKPRDYFEEAILNRVYSVELNFTKEEMLEFIYDKLDKLASDFDEITHDERITVYKLLMDFKDKIDYISLRTYEKAIQRYYIAKFFNEPDWRVSVLKSLKD